MCIKLREIQKITWCRHGERWSNREKSKRLIDVSMKKGLSNWEKCKRLLDVSMEKVDQTERNPKDYLM